MQAVMLATLFALTTGVEGKQSTRFCTEVCYPTCDDHQDYCEAFGGRITTLCSCDWINGNCSLGRCEAPIVE